MIDKEVVSKAAVGLAASTMSRTVLLSLAGSLGVGSATVIGLASPAAVVVGPLVGLALIKKAGDDKKRRKVLDELAKPAHAPLGPPTRAERFEFLLANLMFLIDGVVSDQEKAYLEQHSSRFAAELGGIHELLRGSDTFRNVKERFDAVKDELDLPGLVTKLEFLADLDDRRTPEEVALLVQLINMVEGGWKLPLFITKENPHSAGLLAGQDFFNYLSKEVYEARCGQSGFPYESRSIYVEDPFEPDRLIPLDDQAFEEAQDHFLDGLLALLSQLGAKSVQMTLLAGDSSATSAKAKVEVNAGAKVVAGGVEASGNAAISEDWHRSESVNVTFDNSGRSLLDRLFPRRLEARLLRRYKSNSLYVALIKGRFGGNRIRQIEYVLESSSVDHVAKGVKIATKLRAKIVSANIGIQGEKRSDHKSSFKRHLAIKFH